MEEDGAEKAGVVGTGNATVSLQKKLLYMNSAGVPQNYSKPAKRPSWYPSAPLVDSKLYSHPDLDKPEPTPVFRRPADSWNGSPTRYRRLL